MVRFTSSEYKYNEKDKEPWEKLLIKYYGETILDNLLYSLKKHEYVLSTGKVPSGLVISKALPSVCLNPLPKKDPNSKDIEKNILESIENVINMRLKSGNAECYIKSTGYYEGIDTFEVLSQLRETKNITHWSYSPTRNEVLILLDCSHPIIINSEGCRDARLPSLDLDDGIVKGDYPIDIFPEWKKDFKIWRKKFDENPNEHWNDDIITVRTREQIVTETIFLDERIVIEPGIYTPEEMMDVLKKISEKILSIVKGG